MFGKQRKLEGMLAQSLYEELSSQDQARLEKACANNPLLAQERERMQALVQRLPREQPEFQGNLLPLLREAIRDATPAQSMPSRRWGLSFALCLVLTGLLLYRQFDTALAPEGPTGAIELAEAPSPTDQQLAQAKELVKVGQALQATQVLRGIIDDSESAVADKGRAQAMLADVLFAEVRDYPEAYEAHQTLIESYQENATETALIRWEMLNEAQPQAYAALEALDSAHRNADPQAFQEVIIANPDGWIAGNAAEGLIAALVEEGPLDVTPLEQLASAESRLGEITNPSVVLQTKLALADALAREQEVSRASALYAEVATAPAPRLAQLAKNRLSSLQTSTTVGPVQ